MSTERSTRWTAWTALATSALAVGLSSWSLGCERDARATSNSDTAQAPEPRRADAPAMKSAPVSKDEAKKPKATSAKPAATTVASGKEKEAAPTQPGASAGDVELKVKRLVVTHAIEQREPVAVEALSTAKQVVAFVELANAGADAGKVVITFEHEGQPSVGHIELEVPGDQPRWRTWGKTRMVKTAGEWEAVVSTADGTELAREKFVVGE